MGHADRAVLRVVLAAIAAVLLLLVLIPRADGDGAPLPTVSHSVRQGDTLWSVAKNYTPAGEDVRKTIGLIRSVNGMSSAILRVGDLIEVPLGEVSG